MRIALLTPQYRPDQGPVGRCVSELARGITRAGGTVSILTHGTDPGGPVRQDADVVVEHFPSHSAVGSYAVSPALWSHLKLHAADYDIVHGHGYRSLPAMVACRGHFSRTVFSPHYSAAPETRLRRWTRGPYQGLGRSVLTSADLVMCTSDAEAELVRRLVPVVSPRVKMIGTGADVAAIGCALPYEVDGRVILSVGPLERGKRIDRAISALPDLEDDFTLVIAGAGPERRALEAHAEDLAVSARVRFVGPIRDSELHRWLRTASVFLSLSEMSTSGLGVTEAACAACPVVASDIPAHRSAVAGLWGGASLIPLQGSPLAIADAVRNASTLRVRRPAFVASWTDVADRVSSLYSELIESEPSPRGAFRRSNALGDLAGVE